QVGCVYIPHVVGVRAKQTVIFINSDPLPHNVHSKGKRNKSFNRMMPNKGMRIERKFKRPEVMIQTRCDVHPWMGAHIGVIDHPWFAVSGEDGAFRLEGLPAGPYTLEAWHENLGKRELKVEVTAAGEATAEVSW
ncbi:MAG: carboxypeptidase regulatory-like domain-containing protein, partial [Myxococcota bacterium]|nr:carboxypeptidase regulatory-like domain-containing protein [Myxococcota bacterium]